MDPEASAGARLPFRPRLFHRATDVRLRDKFLAKEGAKSLMNLHFHRNSWGRFAPARASSLTVDRTLRSEPKGGLVEPTIAIRLEIGRASCRERVEIGVVGVELEKKK